MRGEKCKILRLTIEEMLAREKINGTETQLMAAKFKMSC